MKFFSGLLHITLLSAVFFCACGKVEEIDSEITDPQGIQIELTWSNDATTPHVGADLDLFVRQNGNSLFRSTKSSDFEVITVAPLILNNGTYTLEVLVDEISRVTNYKITVTGKSTGKSYTQSFGPINANDRGQVLKPLSLTVVGNKYNVIR
jgi:hypothetical protein